MTPTTNHFDAAVLCQIFRSLFAQSHRTRLQGGAEEPLYQPVIKGDLPHTIYFRHDYFASALHEVAHWCIAGRNRRQLEDYGYWYTPDGRNTEQQHAFEQVEVKPQALEWIFCIAAGYPFRISADNLAGDGKVSERFKQAICRQCQLYCDAGLPERANKFALSLQQYFTGEDFTKADQYQYEALN